MKAINVTKNSIRCGNLDFRRCTFIVHFEINTGSVGEGVPMYSLRGTLRSSFAGVCANSQLPSCDFATLTNLYTTLRIQQAIVGTCPNAVANSSVVGHSIRQ